MKVTAWVNPSSKVKCGNDLNFTEIRGALERIEVGIKVGDNDLGLRTSKSGEKLLITRPVLPLSNSRLRVLTHLLFLMFSAIIQKLFLEC